MTFVAHRRTTVAGIDVADSLRAMIQGIDMEEFTETLKFELHTSKDGSYISFKVFVHPNMVKQIHIKLIVI